MALPIRPRPIDHPTPGTRLPDGADTLYSRQFLQVVLLLSEGTIDGIINDGSDASARLKNIFIDGTPVRNEDGSYNMPGVAWAETRGTNDQAALPGFPDVETQFAVGVDIPQATPHVVQISDPDVSSVIVTLELGALYKVDLDGIDGEDPTGDMVSSEVDFKIELQSVGSGFAYVEQTLPDAGRIVGKATKPYDRSYSIRLIGDPPWNIRVTRISADDSDPQRGASPLTWKTYTEVVDAKLRYPNSALLALEVPASVVDGRLPLISARTRGKLVKVPANYDPVTREYTGTWDGTFKEAYTRNPVWCFYDLATNARYGLGEFLDASSVDKWGLYTISQYCDELVDDGKGGTEPRFSCNLLQGAEDAYRVVRDLLSIFRAMPFWASGAVQATQDAPADSEALFTPANVIDGLFTYSSSSKRARHTVAVVSWNDPANHYQATREYVTDEAGIALYGFNQVEIGALGCTSQGQAQRVGRWLLFTERLETETVTFQAGLDAALLRPGAIITVQDPYRAGVRFGGRLVSATTTALTLDAEVTLEAGKTYSVNVVLPDGTLATSSVTNAAGATSSLALSPALAVAPQAHAMWVLTASDLAPTYYRLLGAREEEPGIYSIIALRHEPTKYAQVEQGLVIQSPPTSIIPSSLAPTGLALSEALYKSTAGIKVRLQAAWDQNPAAERYAVRWRRGSGNWSNEEIVSTHLWEALDVVPGLYWVQVQAICAGQRTDSAQASYTVLGKTAPPADVTGLVAQVHPLTTTVTWSPVPDVDLDHYEVRVGTGTWGAAAFVLNTTATRYESAAGGNFTIQVKAVDTSGNYSVTEARVTFSQSVQLSGANIADGAVASKKLLEPPSDNLVPNGYSEAGTGAVGRSPEGNGLVNDPTNAFEGNWCRKLLLSGTGINTLDLTDFIPCIPGEQFLLTAHTKASAELSAGDGIHIGWYDAASTFLSETAPVATDGASYVARKLAGTAPAGAAFLKIYFKQNTPAADVGKTVFMDAIALRKCFTADLIIGNTIQTSNYAESGGDPSAGAKLDSQGTALKVGEGGLQVGSHSFDAPFFRALTALEGDWTSGRAYYRGNNDSGGRPNTNRLFWKPRYDTALAPGGTYLTSVHRWDFIIRPTDPTDNLDGLRRIEIRPFRGTTSSATEATAISVPVTDRSYADIADSNGANISAASWEFLYGTGQNNSYGASGPFWFLLCRLVGVYGKGPELWYSPPSSAGTEVTGSSTSPITGAPAPDPGAGDPPIGGGCPAPWVPFLLAAPDGRGPGVEIPAGQVRAGMLAWTRHHRTGRWGAFPVLSAKRERNVRSKVVMEDGRDLVASWNHRLRIPGHFRGMHLLRAGERIEGHRPGAVARVEPYDLPGRPGEVIRISIKDALTYQLDGLESHNAKNL